MRSVAGTFLLFIGACTPAFAQAAATLQFTFENAQLIPPKYVLTVHEDGTGRFQADAGARNPDDAAALPSEAQDRNIQLTAATTQRLFQIARAKKFFAHGCDRGGDKVAFTGKKQLSYEGPDGRGACTYNYTPDQQIQWVTAEMQGIAATLEEGRRLELEHEHGRLSLDAELETLEQMVQSGNAVEVGVIAPVLISIVKDQAVLERAQRRAAHLLAIADAASPAK